jgi:dodecin
MSVVKVIELSAESAEGYDDAVRQAMERAARTIRNIRSVWLKEFEAVVENDRVTQLRVAAKISFLLDEGTSAG